MNRFNKQQIRTNPKTLCNWNFLLSPCLIGLFIVLGFAGCGGGPKLHKVKGIVNVDSKPTGGVSLTFFKNDTGEYVSSTVSDPDGSFVPYTLWENETYPGIPAGKYKVAASYPDPNHKEPKMSMGTPPSPPDLFKNKYSTPSPDISFEITSDESAPVIELSMKKK